MKKFNFPILAICIVVGTVLFFYFKNGVNENQKSNVDTQISSAEKSNIFDKFGNATNSGEISQKFAILFSSPFEENGEILIMNGNTHEKLSLKGTIGLGGIDQGDENELWLNGTESKSLYSIDTDTGKLVDQNAKEYTNYLIYENETKIIAYKDKNIDYSQLEVEYKGNVIISERIKGYLRVVKADKNYVYAFADLVDDKESSALYIYNLDKGELENTLPMKYKFANDIAFFQGKVLLTTKGKLTVFDPNNSELSYLGNKGEDFEANQILKINEEKVIVTYSHLHFGTTVVELDKDLKIIREKNLNFPYAKAFLKDKSLYIASAINNDKNVGIIGKFSVKDYHKTGQIVIPKVGNLPIAGAEILNDK